MEKTFWRLGTLAERAEVGRDLQWEDWGPLGMTNTGVYQGAGNGNIKF